MAYPCKLPRIQLDTWGIKSSGTVYTADDLAELLFGKCIRMTCFALLKSNHAVTIDGIAHSIQQLHAGIDQPKVTNGQVYLQPEWRIRWEDMSEELRKVVLGIQGDVTAAFVSRYNAEEFEQCVMSTIGPARAAGVRSRLP